ncbi:tetratricopeptide repeat protein [Flammeovirga sp. SubArs3]|uniref:SEL1-like repeat protein n=1 Tax=Flammeovirga sp. SubArs3 TaxID=2995316 RepID=UPI00248C9DDD|nr:tetratricopeptide repeat protein [Flammeovirga sp. SubArs3]
MRIRNIYIYVSVITLLVFGTTNVLGQSIDQLKKQAKYNNDAESWYQLGQAYQKGEIEKVNLKKAASYYEKAAQLGHFEASLALADIKMSKNEYGDAIKLLKIASKGGAAEASYQLGTIYEDGKNVTKDENEAIYFYLRALDGGIEKSELALKKLPVADYPDKSDIYYQKYLGENGSAESDYQLGLAYKNGKEVDKDLKKSFDYFNRASKKDFPEADYELALFYKNGLLGIKDSRKAIHYLINASNHGVKPATDMLETMDIKTFVSEDDINYLKYQAITLNNAEAQYTLYLLLSKNEEEKSKALEMCQRSALQDYQPAMLTLANLYLSGTPPLKKSTTAAFKWRRQAAYVGSDSAEYLLGTMYEGGVGVQKSEERAVRWYIKAANHGVEAASARLKTLNIDQYIDATDLEYATYKANQGDLNAQLMLGKYYYKNDQAAAINWLQKAGNQNSAEAELYLGDIFKDGKCQMVGDINKAEEHYKKALALGSQEANLRMAQLYSENASLNTKSLTSRGISKEDDAMQYANAYMVSATHINSDNTNPDPQAYLLMGNIHQQNGKTVEAIKQYDLYIKTFDEAEGNHKEFIEVINKQANAYAELGEINSALLQIDIALAKADDFSQIKDFKESYSTIKGELFYTQAILLFKKGDKYKACNVFQKAKAIGIPIEEKYENLCLN